MNPVAAANGAKTHHLFSFFHSNVYKNLSSDICAVIIVNNKATKINFHPADRPIDTKPNE